MDISSIFLARLCIDDQGIFERFNKLSFPPGGTINTETVFIKLYGRPEGSIHKKKTFEYETLYWRVVLVCNKLISNRRNEVMYKFDINIYSDGLPFNHMTNVYQFLEGICFFIKPTY